MSLKRFCDWCGKIIERDSRDYISLGSSVHFCNEGCYEKFSEDKKAALAADKSGAADAGREKGRE